MSQLEVIDPIGDGFRTYLLKVDGGDIVASARTSKAPTGGRLVSDVWTNPKQRGKGYSKTVLNAIFRAEPRPLKLRVGAYGDGKKMSNEQLKEYYMRLGFTKPEGELLVKAANCDPDMWTSDQTELVERLMQQGVQMDKQAGRLPWEAPLPIGPMNDQPITRLPWWRARPGEKSLGDVASDVAGAGRKVVQVARNLVPKFPDAPMARGPYTPNSNRVDMVEMPVQLAKQSVVRRKGKKWQLWTADGSRVLGTHDSAQDAYKQEYAIQKSKERAAKSAAMLQSPQTADALSQLMEAKRESDRKNYKRKHSILRRLIEGNPEAFTVDSMSRGIVGLTHNPTGFRLHMPGTAVPAALAEKQAVSRWRTPDGLRILAPNSVTRLGQLRSAMERLGLTNPYSNSDAFPGLTRALATSKYAPLSTHVDILDKQKIVNDMLRGGKLYRAHVARDPFKGITAGVSTAYASASPAVAVYGSNGGVGLGSGDYKILSTFSEAPDQVHRGQLQAERWLTRKELGRTASGFRRKFPMSWVSGHMYETPISADRNRLMSQLIIRRSAHNIHNIEATPATRKLLSVFKSLEMPDKQFEVASRVAHGWKPIQAPARAGGSAARKLLPALLTLVSRGRMRIKMAGASSTNQSAIELGPIDWKKEKVNPFLQHASGIIGQARIPQPPPVAPPGYTTQALHQVEQNLNWLGRKITGGEAAKFREYYGLLPQPTRTALDNSTAALSRAYWDAGKTNVPPVEFATRFNKLLPAEMRPPAVGEAYKTDVRRAAELVRGNMEKSQAVERVPQKKRRPWWLAPVGTMAAGYGVMRGTDWLVPRQAYEDIKPFADAMVGDPAMPRGQDMSLRQAVDYGDDYLNLGNVAVNARVAGNTTVPDVMHKVRERGSDIAGWIQEHPRVAKALPPAAQTMISGMSEHPITGEADLRHYREFQAGPLSAYHFSLNEYNPDWGDFNKMVAHFSATTGIPTVTSGDAAAIRAAVRDYVNMHHRGPDSLDPVELASLSRERQAELMDGFRKYLMVKDPEMYKREQVLSAAIGAHRSTNVAKQYGQGARAGVNIRRAGLVLGGLLMAGGGYMMVRKIQQMRTRKEEERKKKARPQLRLFPGMQAKAASLADTVIDTVGTVSVPTNGLYSRGYAARALSGANDRLNPIKRLFVAPYIECARAGYETLNPTARMHMDTAASNVARRYGESSVPLRTFIEEVQGKLPPVFQHPAVERASGPKGTNAVAAARVVNGLLPTPNPRPPVWTAPRPQSLMSKSNAWWASVPEIPDTSTVKQALTVAEVAEAGKAVPKRMSLRRRNSGNYKKGIVTWNGLRISIETPAGHWRIGKKEDGKLWFTKMRDAYGYIQRHEGYDGDAVDVFLGPDLDSPWVHVVNQTNGRDNNFDECKCMVGWHTEAEARLAYMRNYTKGWKGYINCIRMSVAEFKQWLPLANRGPARLIDVIKLRDGALKVAMEHGSAATYDFTDSGQRQAGGTQSSGLSDVPLSLTPCKVIGGNTFGDKAEANGGRAYAVFRTKLAHGHTLFSESNGFLDRPRPFGVHAHVFGLCHDDQVGGVVVESVPVDMMYDLATGKRASKQPLHDNSVFKSLAAAIGSNKSVGRGCARKFANVSAGVGSACSHGCSPIGIKQIIPHDAVSVNKVNAADVRGATLQPRGAGAQKLAAFLAPLAISAGGLGTDLITNAYTRRAADRMARAMGPMPREEKALLDLQTRLRTVPVKGLHSPAYISYRDIENRIGVPLGAREPEEARRRGMVAYDPKTTPTAYYAHELGHADVPVWARSDKFTPRALTTANVFSYFPGAAYGAWSGRPVVGAAVGALGRLIGRSPVIVEEYFAMRRANQMIDALPGTPEEKQAHKAALMRAFLTYVIPPAASGAAVGGIAGMAGMLKGK